MNTNTSIRHFEKLFGLPQNHSLTVFQTQTQTRNSTVFEVQWLEERNQDNTVIARYRSWTRHTQRPPYRRLKGWERFCITGELLDREVRYSQRDSNDWMH